MRAIPFYPPQTTFAAKAGDWPKKKSFQRICVVISW